MTEGGTAPGQPLSIDAGLPVDRATWPAGALEALGAFTQGSVIKNPPLFYWGDPENAVWIRTADYNDLGDGPQVIEVDASNIPAYGMVTSQTCDIAEEDAARPIKPWVQIVPVFDRSDLDSGMRKMLRGGIGPRHLLHLPALPDGFWVADLRLEMPIEKGWLSRQALLQGFLEEKDALIVGERIARLRRRPAFAGNFVAGLQRPLMEALRELKQTTRATFDLIVEQVHEVGVSLDSLLDPKVVRLTVLIEGTALDQDVHTWWNDWWDGAVAVAAQHQLTLQPLDFRLTSEISLADYRLMTPLPLDRISPD